MAFDSAPDGGTHDAPLLWWCMAGSALAHVLILTLVPAWRAATQAPPIPLIVDLRTRPPEIEPPNARSVETRPPLTERPKVKPEPVKSAAREQRPVEPAPAPILNAPPAATPAAAAWVAPEQRPPSLPAPPAAIAAPTAPRSDAAYLNNPRPAYPLAARRRGDQGTVLVRVLVAADGLAASVSLEKTSGHPALDESALAAVKSWRFVPARQGGQAIDSPYVVPIVFKVE